MGHPQGGGTRHRVFFPGSNRKAVVLCRDLDGAKPDSFDRVVPAVVPEGELVVPPPNARAISWWPRQMPKTGTPPEERSRIASAASSTAAGSPGPLEIKRPSGPRP